MRSTRDRAPTRSSSATEPPTACPAAPAGTRSSPTCSTGSTAIANSPNDGSSVVPGGSSIDRTIGKNGWLGGAARASAVPSYLAVQPDGRWSRQGRRDSWRRTLGQWADGVLREVRGVSIRLTTRGPFTLQACLVGRDCDEWCNREPARRIRTPPADMPAGGVASPTRDGRLDFCGLHGSRARSGRCRWCRFGGWPAAAGSHRGRLVALNPRTLTPLSSPRPLALSVHGSPLALSPDGRRLAVVPRGWNGDDSIVVDRLRLRVVRTVRPEDSLLGDWDVAWGTGGSIILIKSESLERGPVFERCNPAVIGGDTDISAGVATRTADGVVFRRQLRWRISCFGPTRRTPNLKSTWP